MKAHIYILCILMLLERRKDNGFVPFTLFDHRITKAHSADGGLVLVSTDNATGEEYPVITLTADSRMPEGSWKELFKEIWTATLGPSHDSNDDITEILAAAQAAYEAAEGEPQAGRYVVVEWPRSQALEDEPGFEENAYLADEEAFGSCAYFVDEQWLAETGL